MEVNLCHCLSSFSRDCRGTSARTQNAEFDDVSFLGNSVLNFGKPLHYDRFFFFFKSKDHGFLR